MVAHGRTVADYRARSAEARLPDKAAMKSLYIECIDLIDRQMPRPRSPVHLGFRSGVTLLRQNLADVRERGVSDITLDPRSNRADVDDTMQRIADGVLPVVNALRSVPMAKTILVTGATDGIGLLTARTLAREGHKVLLHGRSAEKLESAARQVNGDAETFRADLSSLDEVRTMADDVLAHHDRLDVLINNAGVFKTPRTRTPEGMDVRFMVNAIAPCLLTHLLLPVIPPDGRVVNLSSAAQAPVDVRAMRGEAELGDMDAYAQSKLAITIWTREMAKQHPDGPVFLAVNPGSLLASKMVKEGFGVAGNDLGIGADILRRTALAAEFSSASGQYFDNDRQCFAPPHSSACDADNVAAVMGVLQDIAISSAPEW